MDASVWVAVAVLALAAVGQIISRDWRVSMVLMALQYFAAFALVQIHWPLTMAIAKLITGWMCIAIVGMTQVNFERTALNESAWPEGSVFRILAAALIALAGYTLAPSLLTFLPGVSLPEALGGVLLITLGLLHLGMTAEPLRVIFGLLTVLTGFEIIYAAIENAILVAALLALINLSLAVVGAYLLNASSPEAAA